MKNLSIIIPLGEWNESHKVLLDRSIESIKKMDVNEENTIIFIGPTSSLKQAKEYEMGKRETIYIENSKNISLPFQINKAVKDVKTDFFTVLEFDDTFSDFWSEEVNNYISYNEDVSLFLPLIELVDFTREDYGAVGYGNEPVWSSSFSEELGFIDEECLKTHYNFIVSGGVFKKNDFLMIGGLKNTLKVFFWYELLLRYCHNAKKVFVIPKIGCEHMINRPDSLTAEYQQMSEKELDFWFNTAQEEYVYKTDRKKTYNPYE